MDNQPALALRVVALLILVATTSAIAQPQKQNIDSLRRVVSAPPTLADKVDALYGLGQAYRNTLPDSTRAVGEALLAIGEAQKNEEWRGKGYFMLGMGYSNLGDQPKAIENLQKSIQIREKLGKPKPIADTYHSLSYAHYNDNNYTEAIQYEMKALELYKTVLDSNRIATCYSELGKFAAKMKKHELAISYLQKSLEICLRAKQSPYFAYSRLGQAFWITNDLDSSGYYFGKALETAKSEGVPRAIATEQNNISEVLIKKGKYTEALEMLQKSADFFETNQMKQVAAAINVNLANVAFQLKDYQAALAYGDKAIAFSGNPDDPSLAPVYDVKASTYQALGQYQAALTAARKYEVLHDSMVAQEHSQAAAEIEAQFRTAENEKTIADQTLQLERQQSRNRLFLALAIFALITGAGIALFLREKRRRAELALQLKDAEAHKLKELDQVKSAFFANISHEFRTPLTLILGPLREMEDGTFRGDARKYYGIMRRNASRLLQLVNQLLDLSRLESGKLKLDAQPGDLAHHLRAVAGSFQSLADQRQIDFRVDVPDQPIWAKFDPDKLEKIVGNLLSNAFKFTPEEGKVELGMRNEESGMMGDAGSSLIPHPSSLFVISIKDTGIGIPAEHLPHIFERFYQVENTGSDLQPGSGIGLALTKELVELHGGQISVESIENQGTKFVLTFIFEAPEEVGSPQSLAEEAVPPQSAIRNPQSPIDLPAQSEIPALSADRLNRKSDILNQKNNVPLVLIAEDHPDVRSYVAERLAGHYQLLEATNGQEALDMALAQTPDLILTDLMMPVMDGMELTQKLKADVRTNHIPVVMLTAKGDRTDRIGGIETGAEAYLTKPFDAEELRATLANLLAQRRILQEKFAKQIMFETPKEAVVSMDDKFLHSVLEAIEANLDDETFGVEQLAAAMAMSRSNLFRKVEALLGKSPVQLLRERRLLKAKYLLESGAGNSTEVAYMVGFQSLSYFSKCYQEMFGEAPGQVARRKTVP